MSDELKPCPWCGSPAKFYAIARGYQEEPQWAIICTRDKDAFCPAGVPHFAHNEQQVTANMWNCRAQETIAIQDLRAENAKLKARVEAAEYLISCSDAFGAVFILPDEVISEEDKLFQEAFAIEKIKNARSRWEALK